MFKFSGVKTFLLKPQIWGHINFLLKPTAGSSTKKTRAGAQVALFEGMLGLSGAEEEVAEQGEEEGDARRR
jgi:hypothetical protein